MPELPEVEVVKRSLKRKILNSIINKSDNKKETRSKLVRENFSWENVVKKLKKEFEKKLSK